MAKATKRQHYDKDAVIRVVTSFLRRRGPGRPVQRGDIVEILGEKLEMPKVTAYGWIARLVKSRILGSTHRNLAHLPVQRNGVSETALVRATSFMEVGGIEDREIDYAHTILVTPEVERTLRDAVRIIRGNAKLGSDGWYGVTARNLEMLLAGGKIDAVAKAIETAAS